MSLGIGDNREILAYFFILGHIFSQILVPFLPEISGGTPPSKSKVYKRLINLLKLLVVGLVERGTHCRLKKFSPKIFTQKYRTYHTF